MQGANAQIEAAQQMAPELLLLKIENRLARLEDTFMQLSNAISKIGDDEKETLGKTLYAVAMSQTEQAAVVQAGTVEQKTADEGTIEETSTRDEIKATSEELLEGKEGVEEVGTWWREASSSFKSALV